MGVDRLVRFLVGVPGDALVARFGLEDVFSLEEALEEEGVSLDVAIAGSGYAEDPSHARVFVGVLLGTCHDRDGVFLLGPVDRAGLEEAREACRERLAALGLEGEPALHVCYEEA